MVGLFFCIPQVGSHTESKFVEKTLICPVWFVCTVLFKPFCMNVYANFDKLQWEYFISLFAVSLLERDLFF
jgi:hypothetical protein